MQHQHRGFTLIELIAVMILVGILSVALMSRVDSASSASVQAGRDSLVAALFFAQQVAMARGSSELRISGNSIEVRDENDNLIPGYPLVLQGAGFDPGNLQTLTYDRLGRTTGADIRLTNNAGVSATVTVEDSGYAHY